VADFDAGGPSVDDDPADLVFQDWDQAGGNRIVLLGHVQRGRELAFEQPGGFDQIFDSLVADHQAGGTEDLLVQHRVAGEDVEIRPEHCGGRGVFGGSALAPADQLDVGSRLQRVVAVFPSGGDPVAEHGLPGLLHDSLGDGLGEPGSGVAGGNEDEAGGGAELSGAAGDGGDVLLGQRFDVPAQCAGENVDRVDGGHFGVDRDRFGPGCCGAHQGRAAGAGSGEADCLDGGVGH
jgi:hypothetical protein